MASVLAALLLRDFASEQQARNSLFPEGADSPIVWGCGAALSHQLHCLLEFPGNPLQDISILQVFADRFGQHIAETMGPVSHGDFSWLAHCPRHSTTERTDAVHRLETDLRGLHPELLRWRASLTPTAYTRWDNLVEGFCVSLHEVFYFGSFDMLEVLASFFRQAEVRLHSVTHDDARDQGPSP